MSKNTLVSILVLNYNGKLFIKECLDSILKSEYPNFEILLLDNASTDGSWDYLNKLYNKNKKLRLFNSGKQLYFTGGNNFLAKKAKGEKLIFLNSDTVVDKNWVNNLLEFQINNPDSLVQPLILNYYNKNLIDNVGGRYMFPGFGFGIKSGNSYNKNSLKDKEVDFVNGTCFLLEKENFINLNGFDDRFKYFYEDVDLCLRAKKIGLKCFVCPVSIIYHKKSLTFKDNVKKSEILVNIKKNRILTVIKNYKGINRLLRLSLFLVIDSPVISRINLKAFINVLNLQIYQLIENFRAKELIQFCKPNKETSSILDLGCGNGGLVLNLLDKGFNAFGIDEKDLNISSKIKNLSIENYKTSDKFDVVTLYHVLEHTKNPQQILLKVHQLLNTNGTLVLEVPLIGNYTENILKENYFAYNDKTHINLMNKNFLTNLLTGSGFKIIKKGNTFYEFPFTILTSGLKNKFPTNILLLLLFLPLKIFTLLGYNDEIVRFYCVKENGKN